jgi:lysophospholipase L1-like esterase
MSLNWILIPLLWLAAAAPAPAAAPLESKDVHVQEMTIAIPSLGGSVKIEPLPILTTKYEGALVAGAASWRGPMHLPSIAWIYHGLRPGSLTVTTADGSHTALTAGVDYSIDADWGTIGTVEGSNYPAGTKLVFEYQYTPSRLDLIEVNAQGHLAVRKGATDMKAPKLPEPSAGGRPVASVYLRHNTLSLRDADVNLIDTRVTGVPPVINADALKPIREGLAAGAPTTIVFFGDSITAMGATELGEAGNFVDRFTKLVGQQYRNSTVTQTTRDKVIKPGDHEIVVVKAGVGGDDTVRGLKRIDTDVLAHHPTVVVIMFGVNDENRAAQGNTVPPAAYRKNLVTMIEKIRAAGGTPVLMTTSMKNLDWVGTAGNLAEYANVVRDLAKEQKLTLIDNFAAWEQLPKRGYNYMIYLDSCINHPGEAGHVLFFEGVKAAFDFK